MSYRRRRRSSSRFAQAVMTLIFFGLVMFSITWLDSKNQETLEGRFRAVDGDSLVQGDTRMRLQGIDAPELAQFCEKRGRSWPCGRASRNALRKLISTSGGVVRCKTQGRDRYERQLVVCTAGDIEINAAMVRHGWAIDYGGYSREEAEARRKRAGIWEGTFEPPVEWRRANRGDATAYKPSLSRRFSSWFNGERHDGDDQHDTNFDQ